MQASAIITEIMTYLDILKSSHKVSGKGKIFPDHFMKAYRGSRGIALLISNPGPRWRLVVTFTPRPLSPGTEPQYPLNGRLGGLQSQSGHFGGEKKYISLSGIRTPDRPLPQPLICVVSSILFSSFVKHLTLSVYYTYRQV
jgi:hypothetical protein